MSGHEATIWGIAYLPGGKRVVSCSADKTVRIWDVEKGEQEGTSMVHETRVCALAVTKDGKRILSGGDEKRIIVWDVETHERIEEWADHTGEIRHKNWINCVLWSLDGSQLFSASSDFTIRCWNSETGKSIGKPWTGHTNYVTSLSLSPDGTKLASTSYDKTIRFWDAGSGEPIEHPLQHESYPFAVAFSPPGEFVASGGKDLKLSIWRAPWWVEGRKQVITTPTYLPTLFLTTSVTAGTSFATAATCRPPSDRTILSTTCTSCPFHPHTYCNAGSTLSRHCTESQSYVSHCCKLG
ncbi:hypothetical protein PAXINDRAFT_92688 [Paxillus involutus ATCC 200175]|uniref:WD40 repeat-like protein n=1 Tax=Paxillus involutus ATCC 200175 TaxID=664439 RepID=A0A0C9T390_PAXIN|nr:hypothetical protein PAXINDRAFT_92688 [Paxillus involutus ATCC 200175]